MKKHVSITIGFVVLLGIVGFFLFTSFAPKKDGEEFQSQTETRPVFTWRFEALDTDEFFTPRTQVFLHDGVYEHDLGVYEGSCFSISESAWELLPDEISGAICWWAGGGREIGVFLRNGIFTLEEGFIEEGSEESSGFRGEFTPHNISIPGYAEVR